MRYIKILWLLTIASAKMAFESRLGVVLFLTGKILRFAFFILFLLILLMHTKGIAGYTFWEVILLYMTFNFIDNTAQLLFRNVYRFRNEITSGTFDYSLLRPFSPLINALFGGIDPLDLPMLVVFLGGMILCLYHMGTITLPNIMLYGLLVCNGIIIAMTFHIFVLALGILTTAVDNTIMLYRDITQMGRMPIDIYKEPFRSIITFIIPVGVMITFPVKALIGLLSFPAFMAAVVICLVFYFASMGYWKYALRRYGSASS